MAEAKFLKNIETGVVFIYTDALAALTEMVECSADGELISGNGAPAPEPAKEPGNDDSELTLDDYKALLEKMERPELDAKAADLEVNYPPNTGDTKVRAKILAAIEESLADSKGDE